MRRNGAIRLVIITVLTLMAVMSAVGPTSAAPPGDVTGTATGVNLTARWWQVALSTGDVSFWDDSLTGGNCRTVDLPAGPVVMVAGTFGGASGDRACSIPSGATVVLPVVNSLWALTDPAPLDTVGEARADLRAEFDGAEVAATINGSAADVQRIRSSRFTVNGAVFGYEDPLSAVSDGYWLVWKPADGEFHVTTAGNSATITSSTTYHFTVG